MAQTISATANEVIVTELLWPPAWVMALVVTHLVAVVFVLTRREGRWRVRYEPIAIVASLVAAGVVMGWLYEQVGYVRLLGLAHLLCWTPVYVWVLLRRKAIGTDSLFGKYIVLYLVIVGVSLVVEAVDVVRYLVGEGQLMGGSP